MITTAGKDVIRNFFGGQVRQIGGSLALGVGSTPPALGDTKLDFEVVRVPVTSISADLANNRIVFKGAVGAGAMKEITELALYADVNNNSNSTLINIHETAMSPWTGGTLVPTWAKVSATTLQVTAPANSNATAVLSGIAVDFGRYNNISDSIVFAYYAEAAVTSFRVRFGPDDANYRYYTVTNTGAGYKTVRLPLSSFTVVGTPETAFSVLTVQAFAGAGGGNLFLDGIRIEDNSVTQTMVARLVPVTPGVVDPSVTTEIEYSLVIAV